MSTENVETSDKQGLKTEKAIVVLLSAGFSAPELDKYRHNADHLIKYFEKHYHEGSFLAGEEFLSAISGALPPEKYFIQRNNFLRCLFEGSSHYFGCSSLVGAAMPILGKMAENEKLEGDFNNLVRYFFGDRLSVNWQDDLEKLSTGLYVIQSDVIYSMFGHNLSNLKNYLDQVNFDSYGCDELRVISHLSTCSNFYPDNVSRFLRGKDLSVFTDLKDSGILLNIFKSDKSTSLLRGYLNGSRTWAQRLKFFHEMADTDEIPFVPKEEFDNALFKIYAQNLSQKGKFTQEQNLSAIYKLDDLAKERLAWNLARGMGKERLDKFRREIAERRKGTHKEDKEFLAKVKRRENPLHPLVALGIAKSVGYEIEYPDQYETITYLLAPFGFSRGIGGIGCNETSPGPFWFPETATYVFRKFNEAGIIDLYNFTNMTFHFNIGLRDERPLTPLIRAMHLTGALLDPKKGFRKEMLYIDTNENGHGAYIEAKAFEVTKAHEFVWGMESASYLGWALGAFRDMSGAEFTLGDKWRNQMADVWMKFYGTMVKGIGSAGLGDVLFTDRNSAQSVQDAVAQLKLIFDNRGARYGELDKIGNAVNPDIKPVVVNGMVWPNVASFARHTVNEAVTEVKSIADSIEERAKEQLLRIDTIKNFKEREEAISIFISEFGYSKMVLEGMNRHVILAEVRELLLGA